MNLIRKISNEEKNELYKRECDTILLITGKTFGEVISTYTFQELRHLQAKMMFFASI